MRCFKQVRQPCLTRITQRHVSPRIYLPPAFYLFNKALADPLGRQRLKAAHTESQPTGLAKSAEEAAARRAAEEHLIT